LRRPFFVEHRFASFIEGADPLKLPCVIDSLADLTGTGISKKIRFGARNKAKLSAAQLAFLTE